MVASYLCPTTMDESTPYTVAAGTIASCTIPPPLLIPDFSIAVTGALIAGTYALAKRRGQAVAGIYAASAALNCGIAGATFFSVRGYVVTPFLDQLMPSRLHGHGHERASADGTVTWAAMRLHGVLDAALSGGVTGSVLNTWRCGTRGTFTGMVFGSVLCTLGQVFYNELGVQRIKYIYRRYLVPSQPATPTASVLTESPVSKPSLLDRMTHGIGLKRLSDEEYLAQMKEERAAYLRRIAKLEAQLEEDKKRSERP
ncbi:hypothetical protein F5148DRAFT_1188022 [Russula earlei]|uniref:Uncharacterized protein n=1 Tax=Russula earlei TaxID=71964 RepID=A0ACC0UCJ0_9AGAM|nr:hypothetical protein F5148DRAFT_1188022 [Russula earlei]